MVFLFQQVRIAAGNELERVVVAHRLRAAKPNLAESAPPDETDELVAVQDLADGEGVGVHTVA